MSQKLPFLKILQHALLLSVAALYLLAPLQKPLLDGFHKLEHTLLNTGHSHENANDLGIAHNHEHKTLSFFKKLLQEDTQGDEQPVKEFKLDKHVVQEYNVATIFVSEISEKNFIYISGFYSVWFPQFLPPPKEIFS